MIDEMNLKYKQAYLVKDGGSILVDFTDSNEALVSYVFTKNNTVYLADHNEGRIVKRSLVSDRLELFALEEIIAVHAKKYGSAMHFEHRTKRSERFSEAESLLHKGNMEKAESRYNAIKLEEEAAGLSDYNWAARALEITRNAQAIGKR